MRRFIKNMVIQKRYRKSVIWASIFGLISLSAIIAFVLFFYPQTSSNDSINFSSQVNIFSECEAIKYRPDRDSCSKDAALYSLQNGGNIVDLYKFVSPFAAATSTLRRSHFMEHAIGKSALIVSNYNLGAARDMCWPTCTIGFFHGLAQEWGEYDPSGLSEYMDFLGSFCNIGAIRETGHEACAPHNIGHLYMSSSGALVGGIALCDDHKDNDVFYLCYQGVVHQNVLNGNEGDIFEGCADLTGRKKVACYAFGSFYSTSISGLNQEEKIERCNTVSKQIPPGLNYCFDGMGFKFEAHGEIPDLKLCENVDSSLKELCVKGLAAPERYSFFDFDGDVTTCSGGEASESGSLGCEL